MLVIHSPYLAVKVNRGRSPSNRYHPEDLHLAQCTKYIMPWSSLLRDPKHVLCCNQIFLLGLTRTPYIKHFTALCRLCVPWNPSQYHLHNDFSIDMMLANMYTR